MLHPKSSLYIHVTITKKGKMSMNTSSVFPRGIEISVSLLPRSDPPSFALFSLAHKSLSLGLSETYFPVETAFLNSIRSYRRANRRGTRARRAGGGGGGSKKKPVRPEKGGSMSGNRGCRCSIADFYEVHGRVYFYTTEI